MFIEELGRLLCLHRITSVIYTMIKVLCGVRDRQYSSSSSSSETILFNAHQQDFPVAKVT